MTKTLSGPHEDFAVVYSRHRQAGSDLHIAATGHLTTVPMTFKKLVPTQGA